MGQSNIKTFENQSEDYKVELKEENGDLIDLQGDTFYFTVKSDYTDLDSEALITKNIVVPTGTEVTEAHILLDGLETKNKAGFYVYQIVRLPSTGGREVLFDGAFIINPEVRKN